MVTFTSADHELEFQPDGTVFAAYNTRYPVPQRDGLPRVQSLAMPTNGQPLVDPVNKFFSYDIPGIAHMVYLSNYIPFDTWGTDSVQYKWLAALLAKVDRKVSRHYQAVHLAVSVHRQYKFAVSARGCSRCSLIGSKLGRCRPLVTSPILQRTAGFVGSCIKGCGGNNQLV
jgi:hypothetical protein